MAFLRGRVEPLTEESWSIVPLLSSVWWRAVGSAISLSAAGLESSNAQQSG